MKIVSGGQTGVDRGALDAALLLGIACGGWCPAGRKAEDGVIPDRYPLTELSQAGYLQRTRQNVVDSDGTLIIFFGRLSGGTRQTYRFCSALQRPYLLLDAASESLDQATRLTAEFIRQQGISTLNVAGPRASGEAAGARYAKQLISQLFDTDCSQTVTV